MRRLVAILLAVFSAQSLAENSHCSKNEKVVFSCKLSKKVVSICASEDLSSTSGYMQYRFGKVGAPELGISRLNEHPLKLVEVETYQAASGLSGSISFKEAEYSYTVYWSSYRSDRTSSNGSSVWLGESGLTVTHSGKIVSNSKCAQASSGDVLEADPYYLHTQVGFPEN